MDYYDKLQKLSEVKNALQDEESEFVFNARLEYLITRDTKQYVDKMRSLNKKWECYEVKTKLDKNLKGIIIFGCGNDGRENKKTLELCDYKIQFWCDSDVKKQGEFIDGVLVLSPWEVVERYKDYLVIIGSRMYGMEMEHKLKVLGFDTNNILWPRLGLLFATWGRQYFDVFEPTEKECFIDAGAYNGDTIAGFQRWTGGKYAKIYSLEPQTDMCHKMNNYVRKNGFENVEILNVAAWNKAEALCFDEQDTSSRVEGNGKAFIQGKDIDGIAGEEEVTFIKMDIEGSELKALEGAEKTIKKYKPRLAISIYHELEDILEIPEYLLKLVPQYKFYIRHYSSDIWETILYASI